MKNALVLVLAAGIAGAAHADVLATESFSYPDGNLVGNSGNSWVGHSAPGSNPVQVAGGAAVLNQGSGSREDASLPFSEVLSGEVFAAFDFTVTGGASSVYFAHFKDAGTTFRSRVFVAAPTQGGDYTIAFGDVSVGATWGSDLAFGASYQAIISYNRDSGESKLWINPVDMNSTALTVAGTANAAISTFALRQAGGNSSQTIDNLVVATTFAEVIPAPGTAALVAIGGLVMAGRRRR